MRIALHHNLPTGGGKRALYERVARLVKDHTVDLFRFDSTAEEFMDLTQLVHGVYTFRANLPGSTGYNFPAKLIVLQRIRNASQKMAEAIIKGRYDLAFVNNCRHIKCPMLLRYLKIPSVLYCEEPLRRFYEPIPLASASFREKLDRSITAANLLLKKVDATNARSATTILTNSRYTRESIYRAYGVWATVNSPGIDVERFRPLGMPKHNKVLSVGRIHPYKGHEFVVVALGHVSEKIRPELVIAFDQGEPAQQQALIELGKRNGVRVTCCSVSPSEMPRLYNEAKLTLFANIFEPLGLGPLESMACGTPVVGVREAGIRETVLHGVTGLLTERDPEEFARSVQLLLTDGALLRTLGERGPEHIQKHWTWERSCAQLVDYMRILLESQSRRAI